jgi:hypothetical protein
MKNEVWSDLKHDHLFILGTFLVVLSSLMIFFKIISLIASDVSKSSIPAPINQPRMYNSHTQNSYNYVGSTNIIPTVASVQGNQVSAVNDKNADVISNYFHKTSVVKIRPKKNNIWVIDSALTDTNVTASSEVDSNTLRVAFLNANSGDKFLLKAGDYNVPSDLPNDLEITGTGESRLIFDHVKEGNSITLNKVKIVSDKFLWFKDFKKVTLNEVFMQGNDTFYLSRHGLNKISNSTFLGIQFNCESYCDLDMEKTTMSHSSRLIRLKTFGNISIRESNFSNFTSSVLAIENANKIEISDSQFFSGVDAFYSSKSAPITIDGKSLYFKNINSVKTSGINLNCVYCSTENIYSDKRRQ